MLKKFAAAAAAALAISAGAAGAAHAQIDHIVVTDGVFEDGGTFSGFFDLDFSTFSVTAWDIVTTTGSLFAGDEYKSGSPDQEAFLVGPVFFVHDLGSDANILAFFPIGPHTLEAGEGFGSDGPDFVRFGEARYVESVPEPAAWALSIAGVALMGAALRRRRMALAAA
jgi:hypothetical protein